MQHWKKFRPAWGLFFAFGLLGPFVSESRFYEQHPKIAWPIFFSLILIGSLYMIYLRGVMLRILLDKSMSAANRNFLWIFPFMVLVILGAALGSLLKRIFTSLT